MQSVAPQNRHVKSVAQAFLNVHWDQKSPLLLGYSGGPDSKALLYALLECGVKPHLAHVDHGWREESMREAELLQEEARDLGCPFFTTRLNIEKSEDAARKGRFAFFASLFPQYQALLLGHQADDLAETVLKRILEGAHLVNLGGMQETSSQKQMIIWRPFLTIQRKEILQFLEERNLHPLIDSSNFDPAYLRARMRGEIFPFLNEMFGKNTVENLNCLAERAFELKQYLDEKVHIFDSQQVMDMSLLHPLEMQHLLQRRAKQEGITLLRSHLEILLKWVKTGAKQKMLNLKTRKILVDKGKIRIISSASKDLNTAF